MASIRNIKKDINFLSDQVLTECFSFLEYSPVENHENLLDVLYDVEQLRQNLLFKINNIPKEESIKTYCKNLIAEMYDTNMKLLEELNSFSENN